MHKLTQIVLILLLGFVNRAQAHGAESHPPEGEQHERPLRSNQVENSTLRDRYHVPSERLAPTPRAVGGLDRSGFEDSQDASSPIGADALSFRIAFIERSLGPIDIRLGEVLRRPHRIGEGRVESITALSARIHGEARRGMFEFSVAAGGSFTPFHSTDVRGFSEADGTWVLCATESDLFARLSLAVPFASLSLRADLQGDPFHFISGRDCLGDPKAWTAQRRIGADLRLPLPGGQILVFALFRENSALYIERTQTTGEEYLSFRSSTWVGNVAFRTRI